MMKERVLDMTLDEAVEAFQPHRWKFYSLDEGKIKVEVPRGLGESFVVEFPYASDAQRNETTKKLNEAGFRKQTVRVTPEW